MPEGKLRELGQELKTVFSGRGVKIFDVLVPTVIFVVFNPALGILPALGISLGSALLFFLYRIYREENLYYALGGVGAVLLAGIFALISNSAAGYFLPGLISNGLTILVLIFSVVVRKPLAALSSHLTRGWPLAWYWHSQVRPAYSEVTIFWGVGLGAKLGLEYWLFQQSALTSLGLIRGLLGWPYTILLLILSYLYGIWRLGKLGGPSLEEFSAGKEPPWQGQKRGF